MTSTPSFTKGIMVVDDEPGRLRLIASHLKQAGFIPLPVRSVEDALEMVNLIIPDLFIINSDVDGAMGMALGHEIRTAAPQSPLLLMGWPNSNSLQHTPLMDDFLTIPFVIYELINKVERLLQHQQPA